MKKILIGSLVLLLILVSSCTTEKICPEPEEKALLTLENFEWAELLGDSSKSIYTFYLINYGYVEAKNIKVKCFLEDKNNVVTKSKEFDMRNIASTSYNYEEVVMTTGKTSQENFGYCRIISCDNCEILTARILEEK